MNSSTRPETHSTGQAVAELFVAAALWGFGFIATRWALLGAGALWLTAIRFLFAFAIASLFLKRIPRLKEAATSDQFFLAFLPGMFLSGSIVLQTLGLRYTTVTRSGFITVLYAVFVPIVDRMVYKTPIRLWHLFFVGLALFGTTLICRAQYGGWNRGDWLTLGCALIGAFHILSLEKLAPRMRSAIVFNAYQAFWGGILAFFFALFFEKPPELPTPELAIVGIAVLTVGSTLVAFSLQVRNQRLLPSSVVSLLFLLESPFAALFAFLIFKEEMMPTQWFGAFLILVSALGAVQLHIRQNAAETPVAVPLDGD